MLLQGLDGISPLGGIVGIEVTRSAGHVDSSPTDQFGQAAEQIDGGDHRAANAVKLFERLQLGELPWPHSQTFVTGSLPAFRRAWLTG